MTQGRDLFDSVGHLELLAQFSHRSQEQPLHLQGVGLGLASESLYTEGGGWRVEWLARRQDSGLSI